MVPIECPNCGRGGSVPPDRLNARLVCKACHTVFHLDNTGRMVLGEPGDPNQKKTGKTRNEPSAKMADFDLAKTWEDIPKAVKFGVPGVLVALFIYMYVIPSAGTDPYNVQAQSMVRAVVSNNKSRAVSCATSDSAENAGKWFDLVHGQLEKAKVSSSAPINPMVFAGNPDNDSEITVLVVLAPEGGGTPIPIKLPMMKGDAGWLVDANKALPEAQKAAAEAGKP